MYRPGGIEDRLIVARVMFSGLTTRLQGWKRDAPKPEGLCATGDIGNKSDRRHR